MRALPPRLASLFGHDSDITHILDNYDWSKIKTVADQRHVTVALAPAFGKLGEHEAIFKLDAELQVMIAAVTRILQGLSTSEEDPWTAFIYELRRSSLIEPRSGETVTTRAYFKEGQGFLRMKETYDLNDLPKVDSWFKDLVNDDDVLQATPLHRDGNFEKIASLVWSKGTGIAAMFRGRRLQVATGVDIGVLRYPDYDNPYFKMYRIKLGSWSGTQCRLIQARYSNGIIGEYRCQEFKPRASTIASLPPEIRNQAVQEAIDLFQPRLSK